MRNCLVIFEEATERKVTLYTRKCADVQSYLRESFLSCMTMHPTPFFGFPYFNSVQLRTYTFLHLYARYAFLCPYYSYSFLLIYFLYIAFPCMYSHTGHHLQEWSDVVFYFFYFLVIFYTKRRGKEEGEGTEGETIHILGDIRIHFLGNI